MSLSQMVRFCEISEAKEVYVRLHFPFYIHFFFQIIDISQLDIGIIDAQDNKLIKRKNLFIYL